MPKSSDMDVIKDDTLHRMDQSVAKQIGNSEADCFYGNCKTTSVQTKCSPTKLYAVVERLSQERREAVKRVGFGNIIAISCGQMIFDLCRWLIDQFNPNSCTLLVHGTKMHLTP